MSIKLMSMVWDNGPERQSDRFVLLALADYANDNCECWPSIEGIARRVQMTDRGVRGVVRRLEADGWLETVTGGGRHGCNIYRINPERGSPRNEVPPGTRLHKTRNETAQNPERGSAEPLRTPIEPSITFEQFWEAYPRKVGKGTARKAWKAAIKKADAQHILGKAARFALVAGEEQFTPHPATWLDGERWEDSLLEAAPADLTDKLLEYYAELINSERPLFVSPPSEILDALIASNLCTPEQIKRRMT